MADIVLAAKFVQANAQVFADYVKYMDRENARVKPGETFKSAFSAFTDYMGNEEKSTGMFDNWNDALTNKQLQSHKDKFTAAQEAGGNMWQQVISFRPEFLVENNIDIDGHIQEDLLKQAARKAINAELKAEGMLGNVVWNAAIHYNTDNIHIHLAFVEKDITRTRGKMKQSSLNKAKSAVLSTIAPRTKEQQQLNEQRKALVDAVKDKRDIVAVAAAIRAIQKELPKKGRLQYNSSQLSDEFRTTINREVRYLFDTILKDEYQTYMAGLKEEEEFYKKSYGAGSYEMYENYVRNKEQDLYARIGNVLLKGAANIDELEQSYSKGRASRRKSYDQYISEFRLQQQLKREMRNILEEARRETEQAQKETDMALLGYSL